MDEKKDFKSGFVALIGRPNVGKSTLLNYLVGQKVAIMSPQPQTTRNKISGIYTDDQEQIVFIDTPGIHKPKNKLDDFMDKSSYSALDEVDVVLFMVEPEPAGKGDQYIAELLKKIKKPVFLVINKIDKVHPDELLSIIECFTVGAELLNADSVAMFIINNAIKPSVHIVVATVMSEHTIAIKLYIEQKAIIIKVVFSIFSPNSDSGICTFPIVWVPIISTIAM